MNEPLGVSIIIPNYNYARYVGQAIESALAQDHPETEVIVVDNGSTDGSRAVIKGFGDRVRAVFLPSNGGQIAAMNVGWPMAKHDIVIFLDSDDMLAPNAASAIARAWTPDTARVQFQLSSMDADGRDLGHVAPKFMPGVDTETLKRELLETGTCPSTQGSGNAYAKWLLEKVEPPIGTMVLDTLLEVNAPFHGKVTTLHEPLAHYRMHGDNDTQQNSVGAERFLKSLRRHDDKALYLQAQAGKWGLHFEPDAARRRSIWCLEQEMAVSRLLPPTDPRRQPVLRVLADGLRAAARAPVDLKRKGILFAWFTMMAFAPAPAAKRLVAMRFVIADRPRWFEAVVGKKRRPAGRAPEAAAPGRPGFQGQAAGLDRGPVPASPSDERWR